MWRTELKYKSLMETIMYRIKYLLASLFLSFFIFNGISFALSLAPSDYTGFRITPESSGVEGINGYSPEDGGLRIDWIIQAPILNDVDPTNDYWQYQYEFSNADGTDLSPALSHIIFELSDIITQENFDTRIFNANFNVYELKTHTGGPGNPDLPAGIYGVKIDTDANGINGSSPLYTFMSTQEPMWGDFYAKSGGNPKAQAWNVGIATDPVATSFTNWIPVPDTISGDPTPQSAPEPATMFLFGSGLIGFAGLGRKFKK